MCDSMPDLDDFNFSNINLDLFVSPPRAQYVATETEPHQRTKAKKSTQELSKRIAETDTLVRQIRKLERERDGLRQQLEEFHQSANEVQTLYANEKQKRIEEQARTEELSRKCHSLDTDLTARILEADQLQAQLDALKVPIEYNELAVRHLKLIQKFEEERALHWHDQAVVRELQKYCKEKSLKIPPPTQRSPRKRRISAPKVDKGVQCDIVAVENKKVATRSQGSQYIGTTTTRSTTTSCFFKYHDVGVNCNLLDHNSILNEVLGDMRSWNICTKPVSPIPSLDRIIDEPMSLDSTSSSASLTRISSPLPPPPPTAPVELKTVGTCTYVCNVQRHVDYVPQVPTIKRSNSRPPSRLMFETVKDENTARSRATTPSPLDMMNNQLPSIPHLLPNAFDELWQIFGHMIYGLLHRRVGTGVPFSNQTNAPGNIINQQEFYNWLQNIYLDNLTEGRVPIQTLDTQSDRNEGNLDILSNSAGSTTRENILDQQTQNCNVASPLNFSNAAPVKCTSSGQYLFKPKAQRSENQAIDEESTTGGIERHSVGTSPIRCIAPSPICTEINAIKDNCESIGGSFEYTNENRTPSAFSIPKSTNKEQTKTAHPIEPSKSAEEVLLPSAKNRNSTYQAVRKLVHKNLKRKRKTLETRSRKRLCRLSTNKISETAVDFIAKLNMSDNKQKPLLESNEVQLMQTKECTNQRPEMNTLNISSKDKSASSAVPLKNVSHKRQLREVNRLLFGSESEDEESDDKTESTLSTTAVDIIQKMESVKWHQKEETKPIKRNANDNQSDMETSYSNYISSSDDDREDMESNRFNKDYQADKRSLDDSCRLNNEQNQASDCFGKSLLQTESNVPMHSMQKTLCSEQISSNSSAKSIVDVQDILKQTNAEPQKTVDSTKNIENKTYDPLKFENRISDDNCDDDRQSSSISNLGNEESIFTTKCSNNILLEPISHNISTQACSETANKNQRLEQPVTCSNKSNEAEALCKILEDISPPLNRSSDSSTEARLVIDTDDDIADSEMPTRLPKRRGRRRTSSSSTGENTDYVPCKRSARLLAKQKVREDQNTEISYSSLDTLGKYTMRNYKGALKCKKDEVITEEEQASKSTCAAVLENRNPMIPVLEYFRENSNEVTATDDEEDSNCKTADSKNEETEDEELTDLSNESLQKEPSSSTEPSDQSNSSPEQINDRFISSNENSFTSSSPQSPTPDNNELIDEQPVKSIPLDRPDCIPSKLRNRSLLYNLISSYDPHNYRPYSSFQLKDHEKVMVSQLELHFKQYLASNAQSEDTAWQLASLVLNASQDLRLIAHALCSGLQEAPRLATTSYESLKNTSAPLLDRPIPSIIHKKMGHFMKQLIHQKPEITHTLLTVIESILFNIQTADTLSVNGALNLTDLYILTLTVQVQPLNENPARLFIAKCIYYHKVKAIPMVYLMLSAFPTTLPHREERNYDRSDALITVIQHTLMCTTYNMENHQLFHRELLSKLRYAYHFEVYKPSFQDVLQNLVEKLRAGKLNNLQYAFALFCKRMQPDRTVRDVIQAHLIPLSNEYYSLLQHSTEYDERTAALLDCFSSVIKPFPRDSSNPLAGEINNYLNIFKQFLSVEGHPIVQEAALLAILRLQRFSIVNCFNALVSFRPGYELQPITRATLKTFIHRKPHSFWKALLNQSG